MNIVHLINGWGVQQSTNLYTPTQGTLSLDLITVIALVRYTTWQAQASGNTCSISLGNICSLRVVFFMYLLLQLSFHNLIRHYIIQKLCKFDIILHINFVWIDTYFCFILSTHYPTSNFRRYISGLQKFHLNSWVIFIHA